MAAGTVTGTGAMIQANSLETGRATSGPIAHTQQTVGRVRALGATAARVEQAVYRILIAADRLAVLRCGRSFT